MAAERFKGSQKNNGETSVDEEEDLEALRSAALAALQAKKLKETPCNTTIQRNNVILIEPRDDVSFPMEKEISKYLTMNPTRTSINFRANRKALSPRRSRSPKTSQRQHPSGEWSSTQASWEARRRGNDYSPRDSSLSPRSRSPSRRSPSRRSRRSPDKNCDSKRSSPKRTSSPSFGRSRSLRSYSSPPREGSRKYPKKESSFGRKDHRKSSPVRSPRRIAPRSSPRRSLRKSSPPPLSRKSSPPLSRKSSPPVSRKLSPPATRKSSPAFPSEKSGGRNSQSKSRGTRDDSDRIKSSSRITKSRGSPTKRDYRNSPNERESKKGRFERFKDLPKKSGKNSESSEDESSNESLLDELLKETEKTDEPKQTQKNNGLQEPDRKAEEDKNGKENAIISGQPTTDDYCLLLRAEDEYDDLLEESEPSEINKTASTEVKTDTTSTEININIEKSTDKDARLSKRGNSSKDQKERTAKKSRKTESSSSRSAADVKQSKGGRKVKESLGKEDEETVKAPSGAEKANNDHRHEEKVTEKITEDQQLSTVTSTTSDSRLEARRKKFLQTELKLTQKVISLKTIESTPREEDQQNSDRKSSSTTKVSSSKSKQAPHTEDVPSKVPILSRLGPPPTTTAGNRTSVKDRIGYIPTSTSSVNQLKSADASKFEVRNRPNLDPKLKIHINLQASSSVNSSGSKTKKVVCIE